MKNFLIINSSILIILCYSQISLCVIAQEAKDNCESSSLKLDVVRNGFNSKDPKQNIILIARLGKKEHRPSLNKRRLHSIKEYLASVGIPRQKIVTTYSDNSDDLGRIEIYIQGQLNEIIFAGWNADIPVGSCDNDKEDKVRYQLKKRKLN